ncbi:MAG: hypothetical protein AAGD22_16725 [Verrucomicrobiota bacterium]
MLLMRLFFAFVVYGTFMGLPAGVGGLQGQPDPMGLARFFDLRFFADRHLLLGLGRWMLIVALALYVADRLRFIALVIVCFWLIGPLTLELSQGVAKHTTQLLGLVLLVQVVYAGYAAVAKRRGSRLEIQRTITHWSKQAIVATYLVTAITKVVASRGEWVKDSKYFPVQMEKTRMSEYYNRLGVPKEEPRTWLQEIFAEIDGWFATLSVRIGDLFLASPDLCRAFLGLGLLLEFLAPVAMLGRTWGSIIGMTLVVFHLTISRIMALHFATNMELIAIYLINVPWLIFVGARWMRERDAASEAR